MFNKKPKIFSMKVIAALNDPEQVKGNEEAFISLMKHLYLGTQGYNKIINLATEYVKGEYADMSSNKLAQLCDLLESTKQLLVAQRPELVAVFQGDSAVPMPEGEMQVYSMVMFAHLKLQAKPPENLWKVPTAPEALNGAIVNFRIMELLMQQKLDALVASREGYLFHQDDVRQMMDITSQLIGKTETDAKSKVNAWETLPAASKPLAEKECKRIFNDIRQDMNLLSTKLNKLTLAAHMAGDATNPEKQLDDMVLLLKEKLGVAKLCISQVTDNLERASNQHSR